MKFKTLGIKTALIVLASALLLQAAGCGLSFSWVGRDRKALVQGDLYLTEGEMRVIALEYKTLFESYYEELFSDSFWTEEVDENMTFEEYVKSYYILEESTALLYLCGVAEERSLSVTDAAREDLSQKAESYFSSLTEDEKRFLSCGSETVRDVLIMYETAFLGVESLLSGSRIEVSEEDGRVVDIELIRTTDAETAEALHERIENGENFLTIAKANTVERETSYSVSREELAPEIASVVFSMKAGETSGVIPYGGGYYIFRVLNYNNSLLSVKNRKNLIAVRRYEGWSGEYEAYRSEHPARLSETFFDSLTLSSEGDFRLHSLLFE